MGLFKNNYDSHSHSLETLNLLYGYDSFLDGLRTIADMGCGAGLDTEWWATLTTRDDPPEPRNYMVYAVDSKPNVIDPDILENNNIVPITQNFEDCKLPKKVDLIWCHDSFQYARDPYKCLAHWKQLLNPDGMLLMAIPQTTYMKNNRLVTECHNNQFYSYNVLNLIYMLAISGFDCKDAYFYRKEDSPWLYAAAYASPREPLSKDITWTELAEANLVNDSIANSVNRYGHARLDDLVVTWLDKNFYKITN